VDWRRAEPLVTRNTLALAATAAALVEVRDQLQLQAALNRARAEGLPVVPLGGGSNVVLAGNLEALVLCQAGGRIEVLQELAHEVLLRVSAACDWHDLVTRCLQQGWYGLENLALIPGQVGAAPIQNIGAYGVEFERFVRGVHAVHLETGESLVLSPAECRFGYRDSIFKGELSDRVVITAVDIALSRAADCQLGYPALQEELAGRGVDEPTPQDVFDAVVAVRRRRLPDPAREPNAGSFFKNPVLSAAHASELAAAHPEMPAYEQDDGSVKLPAAWLIERCGWKGRREGGVGTHPAHALVMVHYGGSSGGELLGVARQIVTDVQQRFDVALEMEPRVYGR
jgi:UDP-N-acetylmuramate dehydrogenase